MSARDRAVYRCQQCGFASPKAGTCPDCKRTTGELVALVEERPTPSRGPRRGAPPSSRPRPLREVALDHADRRRTGIGELDRVLGGGVVPGEAAGRVGSENRIGCPQRKAVTYRYTTA